MAYPYTGPLSPPSDALGLRPPPRPGFQMHPQRAQSPQLAHSPPQGSWIQGSPAPSSSNSLKPGRKSPVNLQPPYALNRHPDSLAGGPGPEFSPPSPNTAADEDNQFDPRSSQYTASVYSPNGSPTASPEAPSVPTFAEMRAALQRSNSELKRETQQAKAQPKATRATSSVYSEYPLNMPRKDSEPAVPSALFKRGPSSYYPEDPLGLNTLQEEPEDSPVPPMPSFTGNPFGGPSHLRENGMMPIREGPDHHADAGFGQRPGLTHKTSNSTVRTLQSVTSEYGLGHGRHTPNSMRGLLSSPPDSVYGDDLVSPSPPPLRVRSPASINHGTKPSMGGGKLFMVPPGQEPEPPRAQPARKPRINTQAAIADAAPHTSLTSLSGLLTRAMRHTTNWERKDPQRDSDWFGEELAADLSKRGKPGSTTLSTVLDGFTFSPTIDQQAHRSISDTRSVAHSEGRSTVSFASDEKWPAPYPPGGRQSARHLSGSEPSRPYRSKYDHRNGHPPRRCCGLPLWLFLTLLGAAALLIILAVALPVALVVVPQQKAAALAHAPCSTTNACSNGGVAVAGPSGTCSCLCTGGFSGNTCNATSAPGSCGTIAAGSLSDATIGTALAPLIAHSAALHIPLNATAIIPILGNNQIDCDGQNALVTLNGAASKKARRQLVVASGTASPSATSTAASASATASSSGSGFNPDSPATLDLARTAILYVLQQSQNLNSAVQAQSNLQAVLGGGTTSSGALAVTLGNGFTVNLVGGQITGPGVSVGG